MTQRVTRCQFIFSRSPARNPVSRVIRCRFIFSGKNDELTPDFPTLDFPRFGTAPPSPPRCRIAPPR